MAIFSDINPNTTSGNQLATILNSFKDSFASGNIGAARDANLVAGGNWIDNSIADILIYNLYDGVADVEIFRLNTATGIVSFPGGGDNFVLTRDSDDSIGPILSFLKKRTSGSEQTQDGDTLGEIKFNSYSDTATEETTSRIRVVSEDATTNIVHGSSMLFETTAEGSGTLIERMRLDKQGNLGLGTVTPEEKIHVANANIKSSKASDDIVSSKMILKKSRLANNGQVLAGDVIGEYDFESTDSAGVVFSSATVKAVATENHTGANRGTKIVLESIKTGGIAKIIGLEVDGDEVTIAGQSQTTDTKTTQVLLDDQATRQLASIDGDVHGSFIIEAFFYGSSDIPEKRSQHFKIKGTYNSDDTLWYFSDETSMFTATDSLIDLAFTNGQNFVIDYVNQIPFGNFIDGRIDMELRRILR